MPVGYLQFRTECPVLLSAETHTPSPGWNLHTFSRAHRGPRRGSRASSSRGQGSHPRTWSWGACGRQALGESVASGGAGEAVSGRCGTPRPPVRSPGSPVLSPCQNHLLMGQPGTPSRPSLPEEGMSSASIRAAPTVCTGTPRASRGPEGTEALKERPPPPPGVRRPQGKEAGSPPGAQGANRVPLPRAQGVGEAQTEPGSGRLSASVLRPYLGQRVTRPQ